MAKVAWQNRECMAQEMAPGKICAEIGVFQGSYSRIILASSPAHLYLIDKWTGYPGIYEEDPVTKNNLAACGELVCKEFTQPNVTIAKEWSIDAARSFADGFFDWVYIDANHSWPGITTDIWSWWPKVKSGGWFTGHDYDLIQHIHVRPVVDAFAQVVGREVFQTNATPQEGQSWGIRKP